MTDYATLCLQAEELAKDSSWDITLYSNISALLYERLENINWAGFYLLREGALLLGPFQGKTACMQIPVGKGVCGTAVKEQRAVRVPDVHAFPGHIACEGASLSEIVLPVYKDGSIIGVLDIDSPIKNRFSAEDESGLQDLIHIIERYL